MAKVQCKYVSGQTVALDYTPAAAVSAGDVVVQNGMLGFANRDIAADKLGSLQVGGMWEVPLIDSHSAIEVGADIYFDDDADQDGGEAGAGAFGTSDTGVYVGKAQQRDGAAAGDNAADADDETIRVFQAAFVEGNAEAS